MAQQETLAERARRKSLEARKKAPPADPAKYKKSVKVMRLYKQHLQVIAAKIDEGATAYQCGPDHLPKGTKELLRHDGFRVTWNPTFKEYIVSW